MKITIEKYDSSWRMEFEKARDLLMGAINETEVFIEHIGSTSIKGLGSKPIIDILIGLKDFKTANNHIKSIEQLGYEYVAKHEHLIPNRRYFTKRRKRAKTHHIHMVGYQSSIWNRHMEFRNHLRTNIEDRDKYLDLKLNLAKKEWNNGSEYADAKSEFIEEIELKIKSAR